MHKEVHCLRKKNNLEIELWGEEGRSCSITESNREKHTTAFSNETGCNYLSTVPTTRTTRGINISFVSKPI